LAGEERVAPWGPGEGTNWSRTANWLRTVGILAIWPFYIPYQLADDSPPPDVRAHPFFMRDQLVDHSVIVGRANLVGSYPRVEPGPQYLKSSFIWPGGDRTILSHPLTRRRSSTAPHAAFPQKGRHVSTGRGPGSFGPRASFLTLTSFPIGRVPTGRQLHCPHF
jgi:hypothetical protein